MSQHNVGGNNISSMTNVWATMASSLFQGATAANRAAVSAMLPTTPEECNSTSTNGTEPEVNSIPASIPSLESSDLNWEFERTVDVPGEITVGDVVTFQKTLTDDDVRAFAQISGDTNRLHLDEEFAAKSRFGERIAHGTLVSGLISAALARLPGLTIYLSQDLEFRGPVKIGDTVSAKTEIVEDLGNNQYRLETTVRNEDDDADVINGEAVVLIDDLPEEYRE